MDIDTIVRRWRENAATAGIRLTDEDVERIVSRGMLDRMLKVEEIIERVNADNVAPDYLHVLSVYSGSDSNG